MSRLLAALAALIFSVESARAQAVAPAPALPSSKEQAAEKAASKDAPPAPAHPKPALPLAASELDPSVRELVRREVEKAKTEMREEMRAELQDAQSARELNYASTGARSKLDLLQLNGYLRLRSDLFDNLDLHREADVAGYYFFARPLRDADNRGTLTSDNMRFRLEPTLNVSESVRVMSQVDMLDNLVLGSTSNGVFSRTDGVVLPFDSTGQDVATSGTNSSSNSIAVKRAWAEVQTPLGLLSFGRMPSSFGLGMLANAGGGIDDNKGDTVDRVQFALAPINTPIGSLVLVPMYEIVATGALTKDSSSAAFGDGQPLDEDPADDAKMLGIKVLHIDTDDEMKRKWDRGEGSLSFGGWYTYKSQAYEFPSWSDSDSYSDASSDSSEIYRNAHVHTLDLWGRYQTKTFRFESELAGHYGEIGTGASSTAKGIGPVLIRQFGGVAQAAWTLNKFEVGGEVGLASGDTNPGMGNYPMRNCTVGTSTSSSSGSITCTKVKAGSIDGMQYNPGDKVMDIRNFRFNQAYRVDLILFRELLGGVTDAFYLKPKATYRLLEGLTLDGSIIYSQAIYASSTVSKVSAPLGIELDLGLHYQTDDGFVVWLNYGMLQPLAGLGYGDDLEPTGRDMTRAHTFRFGMAARF